MKIATRILTIDDEYFIRASIKNYLEDFDYEVYEASNGREGIEMAEEVKPDLILVDLRMPEVDGLDVLKHFSNQNSQIPIIVVSAAGVVSDAIDALRLGAWDYLLKPIEDMNILLHAVEKALERARLIRENAAYQHKLEALVKERTAELQETVQKYKMLAEHLTDAVLALSATGIITYCSPVISTFTQYDAAELLGKHVSTLITSENDARAAAAFLANSDMVIEKPTLFDVSIRIRNSHKCVPGELSVQPSGRDGGQKTYQCVLRDVSARKKAEHEKKERMAAHLRHIQKMDSLGQLAGGIAHDLNNLLTPITCYTELIQDTFDADDPRNKDTGEIHKAATRAKDLIRKLVTFSTQQDLQIKELNLNNCIQDLLPVMQRLTGDNTDIELLLNPYLSNIYTDEALVDQILTNLITNSQDAIEQDGKIFISTANTTIHSSASFELPLAAGNYVLLEVKDSGYGMSTEVIKHIYEPFYTTKDVGKGTGLGLSTVFGIVQQLNGHIAAFSKPMQGTTIKIYFPAVPEKQPPEQ